MPGCKKNCFGRYFGQRLLQTADCYLSVFIFYFSCYKNVEHAVGLFYLNLTSVQNTSHFFLSLKDVNDGEFEKKNIVQLFNTYSLTCFYETPQRYGTNIPLTPTWFTTL